MDSSNKTPVKLSRKIDLRVLHRRIFLKINTREFSKTNALDLLFLFIFLLRWINSNKFELIHLCKSMKSTLTLSINVYKAKNEQSPLHFNQQSCILRERVLLEKLRIEEIIITTIYIQGTCIIILQSFKSFQLQTFLFLLNPSISFSKLELVLIHG